VFAVLSRNKEKKEAKSQMLLQLVLIISFGFLAAESGHVPGREGKCEYSNDYNPMLGHVYSCKIRNAALHREQKFTITGAHQSKGRRDAGVKFVEFSFSNLSHIPEQLFRKFPNLEYLSANGVGLKGLTTIRNASELKVVLFNNNEVTELDADTFIDSVELEVVSIRKNKIEDINVQAFHNLGQLRELYLSDNKIATLHMNTFGSLISLEILSLSGNQLQSIDLELFHANRQLREILLYDNKLTAIHPQTFSNMDNLFNLELHGNLCVDKDIREDDEGYQEEINVNLKVCFESYPSKE
jgi:Leucine-rich repeat (LRR) protein